MNQIVKQIYKSAMMTQMMTEWQKYVEKKKKYGFLVGGYNAAHNYTSLHCVNCDDIVEFPYELSEAKHAAGTGRAVDLGAKKEWERLNKDANTYYDRHKKECEPEPEPEPCKFQLANPIAEWTSAGVTEYLMKAPGELPLLFAIKDIVTQDCKNATAFCVFRHPDSGLLSDPLAISAMVLNKHAAYEAIYRARKAEVDDANQEAFAHEWAHDILERCIYTVEKETEHKKEPPRKKMKSAYGETKKINQDALYVYRLLLIELKNRPGMPLIIPPKTMDMFLNATFYGKPKLEKMPWLWDGHAFGWSGVKATLLYKPHALHAWLLLCQEMGGHVKLVVDEASSDTIDTDIYGFTNRSLPLQFKASGNEGVVCAVLCHGDPTVVHHPGLVLPLAVLG